MLASIAVAFLNRYRMAIHPAGEWWRADVEMLQMFTRSADLVLRAVSSPPDCLQVHPNDLKWRL